MTYLVNQDNYANALPSILIDFMKKYMFDMTHPDLPRQGLSPIAATTPEAAEATEDVYVPEALDEHSTPYKQLQGSLSGNEDPCNFLLDIVEFMDSSVLDFVIGIVPPEAIGQDHEPENQHVLT